MTDKGAAFDKPPAVNERFDVCHCLLRDPNGYVVEIQESLDPAWPS